MRNPHNVLKRLSRFIFEKFVDNSETPITLDEEHVVDNLFICLDSIVESTSYIFESETTLDFDEESNYSDDEDPDLAISTFQQNDSTHDADYEPDNDQEINLQNHFSLDYMKRAVDFFDEKDPVTGQRKRHWSTLKRHFRSIPNLQCINRFRKYIAAGGTRKQKLDDVDIFVYEQFENARYKLLSVHDIDLRRWGLKKARELNLNDFDASSKWLLAFKDRHRISRRKITQLVTKKHVEDREKVEQSAKDFVTETKKVIDQYNPNEVLNTDQVGINLKMYGNRTLSYMGEQSTWSMVRSIGKTTHSYTTQSIITLDGSVLGPLFLCLKEPTGKMSDNIFKKAI
ncbi:unnamed protein product [Rotaria magnacalcarata]|uniref:HTH CENPB-type domain-containing protein n=1 Tax=Rotaria magnacalcarata TaxID=392030 RepID=A0A816PZH2_9BILA|nr:unnamed protein product [Rotaria magnacalcarata]CAF3886369.1 unnamed protein product [Rotaria magnacalcarata]